MNKTILKVSLFVLLLTLAGQTLAIGMVTEPIVVKDMLRGGEITKTITVLNPEKNPVIYSFGTTGQIQGWAKFFQKTDLKKEIATSTIPAKVYYDIIAKITVPKDTPNGKYEGEIFVKQEPNNDKDQGENTISVSQMVSRQVTITVSDKEVVDLKTTLIPQSYDVKQGEALKVRIIYDNQGNIALKPSLQVKITDLKTEKSVFNAIFPYPEEEDAVTPGETKEMSDFEWQTAGQEKGKYLVEVNTMVGTDTLEENSFSFNIGDTSFNLSGNKFLASVASIGGGNMVISLIIIGLLSIALITFVAMQVKKKAKKEVNN